MFCLNVDLASEVIAGSQIIPILFLFDLFSFDDWYFVKYYWYYNAIKRIRFYCFTNSRVGQKKD